MQMVKTDGHVVQSGFTTDEEEVVSPALRQHGSVASRELEDEWVALVLQIH